MTRALFSLGDIAVTPGAYGLMEHLNLNWLQFVHRHQCGDWGDLCHDDKQENQRAITNGTRILSAYEVGPSVGREQRQHIWVLTEADRSMTTIMLPSEY